MVLSGAVEAIDSKGCLVLAPDKKIALIGVEDLIVAEHDGKILIAHRGQDQRVKEIKRK